MRCDQESASRKDERLGVKSMKAIMRSGLYRGIAVLLAVMMILGGFSFAAADDLFDVLPLDDGSVMITGYKGSESDLVLPEKIGGQTVSALGRNFSANTACVKNFRSITIPDTLTTIEPGALFLAGNLADIRITGDHPVLAFEDDALYHREEKRLILYLQGSKADHFDIQDGIKCIDERAFYRTGLVSVRIPGSVEKIGAGCFDQSYRLKDVLLEEGLKTIGTESFANCDKLKQIVIPASVTEIEEAAFIDNHLQEIQVAPGSQAFTVSDGALINTREGILIAYPEYSEAESCIIPEGTTRIGNFAFYRAHHLKEITFPDGLLEIGHGAFLSCNHLTAIELPDSVVRLEDSAFGDNGDAVRLHIPAGVTEIVNNFNDLGITELQIPESVTAIKGSFCSLRNLTEVVIPGSVNTISQGSFAFCKNLASITIPASVTDFSCTLIGCAKSLAVRTEPGSSVEQYCREHQMPYENLE